MSFEYKSPSPLAQSPATTSLQALETLFSISHLPITYAPLIKMKLSALLLGALAGLAAAVPVSDMEERQVDVDCAACLAAVSYTL